MRLIILFIFSWCIISWQPKLGFKLAEFTLNGENKNKLIENRIPDYGFEGLDGCEVEGQLKLNLTLLQDSIIGQVLNVETLEPLNAASVLIRYKDNTTYSSKTDDLGIFKEKLEGGIKQIKIAFVSYRSLVVTL